jgi:hypothetical protein
MLYPDRLYDISRMRYEELVAPARGEHFAARYRESQPSTRSRRAHRLVAWLRATGASVLRVVRRLFGQPLSTV